MKCNICNKEVEKGILDKVKGTFIKDNKGKKYLICSECQKLYKTKKDMLNALVA